MNKYLLIFVALSVLIGGCGKSEEPKTTKSGGAVMQEPAPSTIEGSQPSESMIEEPAMAGRSMGESAAGVSMAMEEPSPPAMEEPMEATGAPSEPATPMEETAQAQPAGEKGKRIYDSVCFACHTPGIVGSPKLGDKALWAPRIAQGMETLVSHAINGFQGNTGVMPPKGGRMDLSDEDIAAAVSYMVEQAQ